MLQLVFKDFAAKYCERQQQTLEGLKAVLKEQVIRYKPEGFMLLECVVLDSSRLGELVILPYGPNNTFKQVPDRPISPRGLTSDISEVIAIMGSTELFKDQSIAIRGHRDDQKRHQ